MLVFCAMQGLPSSEPGQLRHFWRTRPVLFVLVAVVALFALWYAEENWRGKRAWERCKGRLGAHGTSLEYSAYIPAPVPDEKNIFKAPMMTEWFAEHGSTDFGQRLGTLYQSTKQRNTNVLAEVTIVPPDSDPKASRADLVLRYRNRVLTPPPPPRTNAELVEPGPELVPLIVMDEVPITDAIRSLARFAKINYVLDPSLPFQPGGPQPTVSVRWENITAEQALLALLSTYDLQLVENPRTGIARIVPQDSSMCKIRVSADAKKQIQALLDQALTNNSGPPPTVLSGSQMLPLLSRTPILPKPVRLEILSETVPSAQDLSDFFPTNAIACLTHASARLRVEQVDTNCFHVFFGPPAFYPAAEYLAWSDQFTNEFNLIRQAIQRPCARMDGDYLNPLLLPHPNYLMVRLVTQTLAQRAQCLLLTERPEEALRELTLVHDLCRLLDTRTAGHSETLLSAMIDVAVTGLYVDAIADGLRLHAWSEPQLLALEQQLAQIDLPPLLVDAVKTERAAYCQAFQEMSPKRFVQAGLIRLDNPPPSDAWSQIKSASTALLVVVPHGWVYQNMTLSAEMYERSIEVFDPVNRTLSIRKIEAYEGEFQNAFTNLWAHNFMAALTTMNLSQAWQILARNQTRANEAWVACALERHCLARGRYPDTLAALVPEFITRLPADVMSGQTLHYSRQVNDRFALYSIGWNPPDIASQVGPGTTNSIPKSAWLWQ